MSAYVIQKELGLSQKLFLVQLHGNIDYVSVQNRSREQEPIAGLARPPKSTLIKVGWCFMIPELLRHQLLENEVIFYLVTTLLCVSCSQTRTDT